MNKNFLITSLLIILIPLFVNAQNDSTLTILDAPENWRTELLTFPLSFAPSINYSGYEDVRFTKGWSDKNSQEFWTYAFAWYLEKDPNLTEVNLQQNMKIYFDGLMVLIAQSKKLNIKEAKNTLALFQKQSGFDDNSRFIGRIQIYDAFFSEDRITLNVTAKKSFCKRTKKHLVLFYLSPKELNDNIWKKLQKIKIAIDCK